jgi:hypothetical protein
MSQALPARDLAVGLKNRRVGATSASAEDMF